jgi:hypothetical protein
VVFGDGLATRKDFIFKINFGLLLGSGLGLHWCVAGLKTGNYRAGLEGTDEPGFGQSAGSYQG